MRSGGGVLTREQIKESIWESGIKSDEMSHLYRREAVDGDPFDNFGI